MLSSDEKARDEADALPLKERDEIPPIADVPITVVNDLLFPPLKKPSPNSSVSGSTGAPTLSFSQGAQARRTVRFALSSCASSPYPSLLLPFFSDIIRPSIRLSSSSLNFHLAMCSGPSPLLPGLDARWLIVAEA